MTRPYYNRSAAIDLSFEASQKKKKVCIDFCGLQGERRSCSVLWTERHLFSPFAGGRTLSDGLSGCTLCCGFHWR